MRIRVVLSILLVTAMVVGACWLWSHSQPSLGQRPFSGTRIWGGRCAAAAAWCIGHALLAGWTLPTIYRPRPVFIGAAVFSGGIGILGAVTAAGLLLACR